MRTNLGETLSVYNGAPPPDESVEPKGGSPDSSRVLSEEYRTRSLRVGRNAIHLVNPSSPGVTNLRSRGHHFDT